jgi:hypothetical protein
VHVPDAIGLIDGAEVAHGLLLAVLQEHHAGTAELDVTAMTAAMGDDQGRMWAVTIEGTGDPRRCRLTVVKVANPNPAQPPPGR